MKIKILKICTALFLVSLFLFLFKISVQASLIDDIKRFFSGSLPKELSLDSDISLAPDGDINKNGLIDSGDTVRFTYNISNPTNKLYKFSTLNTNIQRGNLNFIRNVSGVTGLLDSGKTVTFPNLRIEPGAVITVSFDASINYFKEAEKLISTEGEIVTSDKQSLIKSPRKEIKAKLNKEIVPGTIRLDIVK